MAVVLAPQLREEATEVVLPLAGAEEVAELESRTRQHKRRDKAARFSECAGAS